MSVSRIIGNQIFVNKCTQVILYLVLTRFDECGYVISPLTVKALSSSGYVRMTRVQEATLSPCLEGMRSIYVLSFHH